MVRQSLTAVALIAFGFLRDPGCGDIDRSEGGPNAPCTRSSDCGGPLVCREGVCRDPQSTGDGGRVGDGGEDQGDASAVPEDAGDGG